MGNGVSHASELSLQDKLYGGGRGGAYVLEAAFFRANLETSLLESLAELPLFQETDPTAVGFAKCVDYPHISEHIYFEGYFHAAKGSNSVPSLNPRSGQQFDKPAAPPLLRAFFLAVKKKNAAFFTQLAETLSQMEASDSIEGKEELEMHDGDTSSHCRDIAALFDPEKEHLLGDLAIQIHYGAAIQGSDLGWHYDSLNSTFHMAVTIHGCRKLHSRVKTVNTGFIDREHTNPFVQSLHPGCVYVSNPANFQHAVEFSQSDDWDSRSIAIQARFLLSRELYDHLRKIPFPVWKKAHSIVSNAIRVGIVLPTLEEVQQHIPPEE